ncbi:DUF368 domain-containing protein [Clostridium tarantellae]|uniref:DUF368 domain-containing protein n=1 Tax=Clostridium tarantellae TaxID=39493 RepID=A0A6I1MNJ9_9CLOT|nr:DUF368 domain-containing protein [Clostridium tarantellae]
MFVLNFIRGIFMAMADSVPGVSGGTIAFILGFYDQFISALDSLTSKNSKKEKKKALTFLFKIGCGWVFGFIFSVLFISTIFEKEIYKISSLFVGFIIVSIPIILKEEKKSIIGKYQNISYLILGAVLVGVITYFNPVSNGDGTTISLANPSIALYFYVFICGMIAISAMVLPGISGSTLLLIFGLYAPIISGIKETLTFNLTYVPILFVFGLGVITGILTTIKVIKKMLICRRSQLIYFILGLMIASIYAVFMGPTTLENPLPAMNMSTFSILFFIIGGGIIVLLEQVKLKLEKKKLNK